jgi:hypothetical protein
MTQSQTDVKTDVQLESELLYEWRFTANQFILTPSRLRLTTSLFFFLRATEPLRS